MDNRSIENKSLPDRLLNVAEVGQFVGLSRAGIYKRLKAGDFPAALQVSPGAVRWRQSEVLAWIDSRQRVTHHPRATSAAA